MTEQSEVFEAFAAAIDWFHDQLDHSIDDHIGDCSHPECEGGDCSRPRTARRYFAEQRGWDESTLDRWRLGYAPGDGGLADALRTQGYSEETLRATGLFTKNLTALWRGRYVLPYFDADGTPVCAIARCTGSKGGGSAGYDGHPEDFLPGKYAKVAHTKEYVPIDEPIFGQNTLREGGDVIIAEGIADAITAAEAGHSVLSPVTKEFKRKHFDELLAAVDEHNIERVFVVPDSERATFSDIDSDDRPAEPEHIYEAINLPKVAPGTGGALRTGNYLSDHADDVAVRVVELPRSGLRKVDLDDYLHGWADTLAAPKATANPPNQHPAFESATATQDTDTRANQPDPTAEADAQGREDPIAREGHSALWDLDVGDVNTDLDAGYRGTNPLGHTGESENYFVVYEKPLEDGGRARIGKDYKRPGAPRYTGVTYLLVEEGERDVSVPEGPLSPRETWIAWSTARERELIDGTDMIPSKALRHIADERNLYDFDALPEDADELPAKAHNRALGWLKQAWVEQADLDLDSGEDVTARRFKSRDPDAARTWEDVRYIYEQNKEDGRFAAVNLLRETFEFLTPQETEKLHVYNQERGIFDQGMRYDLTRLLDRELGTHYNQHEKNEILGRLKEETAELDELEAAAFDGNYLCVENGVLDLDERELHPHDTKYNFTTLLPVTYDSKADCPRIEQFLAEITRREADRETMVEILGNALLPNYDYEKVMVLFGEGSNGKSTWFDVVRAFLGRDNVTSMDLQTLAENQFAASNLVGKWANLGEDLPDKKIHDLGTVKDLSGGGETWVEPKGKDGFDFENRAKLMFAANRPPVLGERSKAVKRRLVPIHLPYQFTEDEDDEHKDAQKEGLVDELTTGEELSGLLNLALDGLDRLREQGDVSLPEDHDERLEYYERYSDHIKAFRVDCLTNEGGERVEKSTVYNAYTNFCNENDHEPVGKRTFWRQVRKTTLDVSIIRPRTDADERPRMLDNVTFTDYGRRFAPEYAAEADEEEGEESDSTDDATPVGELDSARRVVRSRSRTPPPRDARPGSRRNRGPL